MAGIFFGPHKGPQWLQREIGPMMSLYPFLEKTERRSSQPPLLCPAKSIVLRLLLYCPSIISITTYLANGSMQFHQVSSCISFMPNSDNGFEKYDHPIEKYDHPNLKSKVSVLLQDAKNTSTCTQSNDNLVTSHPDFILSAHIVSSRVETSLTNNLITFQSEWSILLLHIGTGALEL